LLFPSVHCFGKIADIAYRMHLFPHIPTLLTCVLLVFAGQVVAQGEFAPPGAEWCLSGYDGEGETIGYVQVRYERDTLVAGVPTKVLSVFAKALTPDGLEESYYSPTELFQQSADSVFYYEPVISGRVYLFKENYAVGEETYSWLYNEAFVVSSVEETEIDGVPISVAKMNLREWLGRDLPTTMYGSLGPDRGFTVNWSYFLEGEGGLNLEAFRATETPEIKIVARSACFALMEQPNERVITPAPLESCSIVSFPNPVGRVSDLVRIKFDCGRSVTGNFLMTVYTADGKMVSSARRLGGIPGEFRVGSLPAGTYFAVVSGEGLRFSFSFTKNR